MQKLIDLIRDHRRRHASHSGDDWTDHDLAKAMANVVAAAGAGNAAALGVVKVLMEKCPGFAAVVERVAGAEESERYRRARMGAPPAENDHDRPRNETLGPRPSTGLHSRLGY
jgi:hypothetical protein